MASRDRTGLRLAGLLAATGGATLASARLTSPWRHVAPAPTFDDLLLVAASWALLLATVWSVVLVLALALEAASCGRVTVTWLCPVQVRRALLASLGIALAGGVAGGTGSPAAAVAARAGGPGAGPGAGLTTASAAPPATTLPLPARPVGRVRRAPGTWVVVRPGDTLWDLIAGTLPGHPPPAVVAQLVQRVHRTNRAVIGADPDHIEPGQRLVIPHQRGTDPQERTP